MAIDEAAAVVTGPDGQVQSFGSFLRKRKEASGLPVTRIATAAGISRANFYLLEKDRQRPTLPTLVGLFTAMGLETVLPNEQTDRSEPDGQDKKDGDGADLVVLVGDDAYRVEVRWSEQDRAKSRDRYLSTTSAGLGMLLDAAGPALGAAAATRLLEGGPGLAAASRALGWRPGTLAPAAPYVLPAAAVGSALYATARRIAERRAADRAEAEAAPSPEAVMADFKETAEAMSTEELEALLATMKAMRAAHGDSVDGTPGQVPTSEGV